MIANRALNIKFNSDNWSDHINPIQMDNRVQAIHVDNSVRASVIDRDLETGETKPSISATQSVIPKQGFFTVNLKDEIDAW